MKSFCLSVVLLLQLASAAAEDSSCTMYLAESSTSSRDDFKWGMYAGVDILPSEDVSTPDVAIQTINMLGNARTKRQVENDETSWAESVVDFLEQFIWVPDASGGKFEVDTGRIVTAIPGVGALGAYNADMTNSLWNHSRAYFRLPTTEKETGVAHAGRGASSTFYDVTMSAKHRIPAGMEVFVDYGDNYEKDDEENEITRKDYDRIDQVITRIIEFYDEFESEMTEEAKKDIYDFLIKDVMGAVAGGQKGTKIRNLLPDTPEGLREVKAKGGSYLFNKPGVLRDMEWLQKNGLCMDNLKMGPSTIPHAGRGAFAVRPIKKGALVTPMPMVHLPEKSIVDMHEVEEADDGESFYRTSDEVTGKQLILNYCFGHPQSSMLFFPAGSGASFINHNSKPNAKIVWSSHEKHHAEWFDVSLKDLMKEENQYLGLLMEVVATRDIKEGEEVFIDYGKDWEKAWKEHVKTWNSKLKKGEIDANWPLQAVDMNSQYKKTVFKTPEELEAEPYPEDVQLMCFLVVEESDSEETDGGRKKRVWTKPEKGTVFDTEHLYKCRVVGRKEVEASSAADMPYKYSVMWSEGTDEETLVVNVPHGALVFVDKAGTSDQFVKDAFRHHIGIPDDVFPKGPWRDLA